MSKEPDTLYLIDASDYIFRAYFALPRLTTSSGTPVNAVYGFVQMVRKVLKDHQPKYVALCLDTGKPTFRHKRYAEYKAHRPPPPEDLVPQFPLVDEAAVAFRLPRLVQEGYEADDVIATMTAAARREGLNTVIVSGDKDLMQLIGPGVRLFESHKGRFLDREQVVEKFGVEPGQLGDLLALLGDASDNVPGVPGIGKVSATALLQKYGGLEELYRQLDSVKPERQRKALLENRELAWLSRELVTLDAAVPGMPLTSELAVREPDGPKLAALCQRLEFRGLLDSLGLESQAPAKSQPIEVASAFDRDRYQLITKEEQLNALCRKLEKLALAAIDTETSGLDPHQAQLAGISLALAPNEACYIPVGHRYLGAPKQLPAALVCGKLAAALGGKKPVGLTGHNLKFDWEILHHAGLALEHLAGDTLLAAHLLEPDRSSFKLASLIEAHFSHRMISFQEAAGAGSFTAVDLETATRYSAEDADAALRLHERLEPRLQPAGVDRLYREVELPLLPILARMEVDGVLIGPERMREIGRSLEQQMAELTKDIYQLAGRELNINSPKQLAHLFFEELKYPVIRKTKTGNSTDQDVLETLAGEHDLPLPQRLLDYRTLAKLKSTYADALPKQINPRTGRLHTSFNQAATATGRLSSSEPNLQNIPIRSEIGRSIRGAFIAPPGHLLLAADYSQIELRVLAHLSQDGNLRQAFLEGADIHARTASEVFEVALDKVTPAERRAAKAINFGIIYGQSGFGLARSLKISKTEAQRYIDSYFERFRRVKLFKESLIEEARAQGRAKTMLGRFRPLRDLASKNPSLRQAAERIAVNTTIQGSAAEIIKLAMIRVSQELARRGLRARMILQVHDELVFELPEAELEELRGVAAAAMGQAMALTVPLVVDMGAGPNWALAH